MAMKKPTKTDIEAGRVYRCGNCDALCDDEFGSDSHEMVMGRKQLESQNYYCSPECFCKHSRDTLRPDYEDIVETATMVQDELKALLTNNIKDGKKSKTVFQAIKMCRQEIKTLTMLLSGEYALHIVRVEFFKLSEIAMELSELVADKEDTVFIERYAADVIESNYTEYELQNLAMWARTMTDNTEGCLSLWFN